MWAAAAIRKKAEGGGLASLSNHPTQRQAKPPSRSNLEFGAVQCNLQADACKMQLTHPTRMDIKPPPNLLLRPKAQQPAPEICSLHSAMHSASGCVQNAAYPPNTNGHKATPKPFCCDPRHNSQRRECAVCTERLQLCFCATAKRSCSLPNTRKYCALTLLTRNRTDQ
jgi:hypothetical protein